MGDKIDIFKIILDFLKGNKVLMYVIVALLSGGAAGYKLPQLFSSAPVEVIVNVPKSDELKAEIKKLKSEIRKLKRWHGGG